MNNIDDQIDNQLKQCVSPGTRKSFFLFAGAGSGKTYSLVRLLNEIKEVWGERFAIEKRHVAVITYTNAATNEILRRLGNDPLFHVSTIHSFVWDIINLYQYDIKRQYSLNLEKEISDLSEKQSRARIKLSVSFINNEEKIQSKRVKLERIPSIRKFSYNPNGNNLETDSLGHADVIKISTQLIQDSELLQKIIAQQYPFLLIDESQDTRGDLIDAFFQIQSRFHDIFTLGLFGDVKQRIYTDGKDNMVDIIPETWEKPVKHMNYRSATRIIQLANTIGLSIDNFAEQQPRDTALNGFVRLFLVKSDIGRPKEKIEDEIMDQMGSITNDNYWKMPARDVKILCLEHKMAARRLGFAQLLEPFLKVDKYNTDLYRGTVSEFELFSKRIFPIVHSMTTDGAMALSLLQHYSPLLSHDKRDTSFDDLLSCREAVNILCNMAEQNATIRDIIQHLIKSRLLIVDDVIARSSQIRVSDINDDDLLDKELFAWAQIMDLPINMMKLMDDYLNSRTRYDTHQGVKGLEFDRVMAIIDDSEAGGFLFSYDKIFGVKELSATDIQNELAGKDTMVNRTSRLFYVICTRAKNSLAIVMYTNDPERAKHTALANRWFNEDEVVFIH